MISNSPTSASTTLHPATHVGAVTLAVSDLAQSVDFYTRILGMTVLNQESGQAIVGAGSTPLLHLQEIPGVIRQPSWSTGLYHVAILFPSRPDLGRVLINMARHQYQPSGYADHLVSEAIYLDDPDGNGLELYRDRPRSEWKWSGGRIVMASDPIDLDGIIASVQDQSAPYAGMPDGTIIGHVHLRVGNIPQAEAFYNGILGFDVVASMGSALFISAGGYHHHIGMNIWHSRGAPPAPANAVGLREYTILVPDAAARDQITARLDNNSVTYQRQGNDILLDDPWSNHIRVIPAQA